MNILNPAVAGDTEDFRTIRLGGATGIAAASSITVHIWRHNTTTTTVDIAATDAGAAGDDEIEVDLGSFLTTATPGEYWVEVDVDGTTWPGARQPAKLTVRDDAPPAT